MAEEAVEGVVVAEAGVAAEEKKETTIKAEAEEAEAEAVVEEEAAEVVVAEEMGMKPRGEEAAQEHFLGLSRTGTIPQRSTRPSRPKTCVSSSKLDPLAIPPEA
jgi:hypothetical protein